MGKFRWLAGNSGPLLSKKPNGLQQPDPTEFVGRGSLFSRNEISSSTARAGQAPAGDDWPLG